MRYTSATGERTFGAGTEVIFKEPLGIIQLSVHRTALKTLLYTLHACGRSGSGLLLLQCREDAPDRQRSCLSALQKAFYFCNGYFGIMNVNRGNCKNDFPDMRRIYRKGIYAL